MNNSIHNKLFTLLRYAITNGNLSNDYLSACSTDELKNLLKISANCNSKLQ